MANDRKNDSGPDGNSTNPPRSRRDYSWMELAKSKGGPRRSAYSAPEEKKEEKKSWIERTREEAAEFKRERIDKITK